jgi:hypothetical protein
MHSFRVHADGTVTWTLRHDALPAKPKTEKQQDEGATATSSEPSKRTQRSRARAAEHAALMEKAYEYRARSIIRFWSRAATPDISRCSCRARSCRRCSPHRHHRRCRFRHRSSSSRRHQRRSRPRERSARLRRQPRATRRANRMRHTSSSTTPSIMRFVAQASGMMLSHITTSITLSEPWELES